MYLQLNINILNSNNMLLTLTNLDTFSKIITNQFRQKYSEE